MRLIEKIEAADEETQVDFMTDMDAAMTGRSKEEILEDFRRAKEAAEEDPDGEDDPGADDVAGARDAVAEGDGAGDPKEEDGSKPEKACAPVPGLERALRGGRDRQDPPAEFWELTTALGAPHRAGGISCEGSDWRSPTKSWLFVGVLSEVVLVVLAIASLADRL